MDVTRHVRDICKVIPEPSTSAWIGPCNIDLMLNNIGIMGRDFARIQPKAGPVALTVTATKEGTIAPQDTIVSTVDCPG